mmetsp:Transcript_27457/g.78888  ORF Transcript_27457/g.78888 Transcript_27457/m.78888 type:complete len:400 (-) Transcript_27457:136-1335(-)
MFGDSKKKKKGKDDEKTGDKKEEKEKDKAKDKAKDKDKKEKKEKKEKKKPSPLVIEVVEVLPIPKKDKLKLCKVRPAAGADPVDVVTSAVNVVAGKKFVVAPPGATTANGVEVKPAPVGGVESLGMFCGPAEMGWATDELEANHAIMVADSVELGSPAPSYEEALQMHKDRVKAEKEKAEAEAKAKKGGKKGAKPAKEEEDLDALLNEFGVEVKATDTSAKGKKGKKGKQEKKQEEDEDFDSALNEFKEPAKEEAPKEEAAEEEAAKEEEAAAPPEKKPLAKPKFGKVKDMDPDSRGVNLKVKCVKDPEKVPASDSLMEAVCGDDTGIVIVSLRGEAQTAVCKKGASIRIQNATVRMVKGHIRLVADKWAAFKAADEELTFEVKEDNDMSATEYELVDS